MSGAKKQDVEKLRFDLIPPEAEFALADILTFGAQKYGDRNWEAGFESEEANFDRVYAAIRRHLNARQRGEVLDPESGRPHTWHALCGMAFLVTYEERGMLQVPADMSNAQGTITWSYSSDGMKVPAPEAKLPYVIGESSSWF